jgi:hypothetical protein
MCPFWTEQIRQKCGIPQDKMPSLNLTYRCKDPNNGSPMTLEVGLDR